uniref:Nucleoporin NSP1-like C-terminal domain-containing protein n=1 Tax=Clastoptera arizonana TaxID=38151 RepID=A0A1B6CY64_9HEMI
MARPVNKKVVTFKVLGDQTIPPSPIYDCEVPIYPVDFPCQHRKPLPWWESEVNFLQFRDLVNIWLYELGQERLLFQHQVNESNQRDIMIISNQNKITSLYTDVSNAWVEQRRVDCEFEMLCYQLDFIENTIKNFEQFYKQQMNENQCKKKLYQIFEDIYVNLKQMEYTLLQIHVECAEKQSTEKENNAYGQIHSIADHFAVVLQKMESRLCEIIDLLNYIEVSIENYITKATEYAVETNYVELMLDIQKFKKKHV